METKFTKGKWFAVDYAGTISIQNGDYYGDDDILCYQDFDGQEFCISQEEAEANAKLIVAAPLLLEALQLIVDRVERDWSLIARPEQYGLKTAFIAEAKEAIKKATE